MARNTLDQLLVTLDVAVEAVAICEVRRGLRLIYAPIDAIEIHYVLQGKMFLMTPGMKPLMCGPGTIVIVPPRTAQSVTADDGPARDVVAAEHCSMTRDGMLVIDAADGGPGDLRIICGVIMADFAGSFGLLDRVAAPIAENLSEIELVQHAFVIMLEEINRPGFGTRALTGALMKACLVMVLRRHFDITAPQSNLFGPLRDPRLGKAVSAVLDHPAARHTVASLAGSAGMSRSSFAREFADTFKMTPMEFVAKTRLHHAAELLRSSTVSVKVIAASIGFASRSHFSRAFRDAYGADPSSFRKKAASLEIEAPRHLRGSRARFALDEEPEQ